jgi:hypothetical protein
MKNATNMTVVILLLAVSNLSAGRLYVSMGNTNAARPYDSWATAAANIQDAVSAAAAGDEVVVTDGMYAGGLAVGKPLAVRSVNGPQFTVIKGGSPCVSLTDGASLSGFTVTGGVNLGGNGGGVWCTSTKAFLTNCALTDNWAVGSASYGYYRLGIGGGVYGGTLFNCTLTGNSATDLGGGAYQSTLYNCTLTDNSAQGGYGSGVVDCTLYNCIVYFNPASGGANYEASSILNYCCTTPQPTNGVGNITNAPMLLDYASGNLRLQSNSPCINAGNNAFVSGTTDMDGNPRIVNGTVDIGAYEYQGPGSVISYAWLQQYSLPTDGSADYADPDRDGMNNWQEWVCGTDPTNPLSVLRMVSALPTSANVTVSWQSVAGVNYFLERSANLRLPFALVATNIVGQASTTTYADTQATGAGPFFYRVGVTRP